MYDPHAPGLKDLPMEVLAQIAHGLDMNSLNALRLTSQKMKAVADDAAARDAKKIQAFLKDLRANFKQNVLHRMDVAVGTFDHLKGWAGEVKAMKPPKLSTPGTKSAYRAAKAPVTKALMELAAFVKEAKDAAHAFIHHIEDLRALLHKDLQAMASVDKKERGTKRGGKIQLTYDEIESALSLLDQTHKGTLTVLAQLDRAGAELTAFGKEFSSKFAAV